MAPKKCALFLIFSVYPALRFMFYEARNIRGRSGHDIKILVSRLLLAARLSLISLLTFVGPSYVCLAVGAMACFCEVHSICGQSDAGRQKEKMWRQWHCCCVWCLASLILDGFRVSQSKVNHLQSRRRWGPPKIRISEREALLLALDHDTFPLQQRRPLCLQHPPQL